MEKLLTKDDISYVSKLVEEAGRLALEMRDGVSIQEKTGPQDIVTAADFALSKMLVNCLGKRFPNDVIVSEEDKVHLPWNASDRVWMIDPIDGTDNYIRNDAEYSVMVGLVENLVPVFGWVYAPVLHTLYFGSNQFGAWKVDENRQTTRLLMDQQLPIDSSARIIMGSRDRKLHPWVKEHPRVTLVGAGSVGIKVAKILDDKADIFVHLSGALKVWDIAAPAAVALGGGLEIGGMDEDGFIFPAADVVHRRTVVIGRKGSLQWCHTYIKH